MKKSCEQYIARLLSCGVDKSGCDDTAPTLSRRARYVAGSRKLETYLDHLFNILAREAHRPESSKCDDEYILCDCDGTQVSLVRVGAGLQVPQYQVWMGSLDLTHWQVEGSHCFPHLTIEANNSPSFSIATGRILSNSKCIFLTLPRCDGLIRIV